MDSLRGLPIFVVAPFLVILGLVIIYVVLKALHEGREVSFWPPRIGARPSSEGRDGVPKKIDHPPSETDDPFSAAMASPGTILKRVSQVATFPDNALAFLYVEAGPIAGTTFVLTTAGDSYLFGTMPACDFVLPGVSRAQFRIRVLHGSAPASSGHPYQLEFLALGSRIASSIDGVNTEGEPHCLDDHSIIETGGLKIHVLKLPR